MDLFGQWSDGIIHNKCACLQVSVEYMVEYDSLSPEQALDVFEQQIAETLQQFSNEQQREMDEMTWKKEFGFDDVFDEPGGAGVAESEVERSMSDGIDGPTLEDDW